MLISGRPINGPQFSPIDLSAMKELKLVVPSERHLMGATLLDYITGGQIVASRVMKVDGFVGTIESIRRSDWGAVCQAIGVMQYLDRKDLFIYPIFKPVMHLESYFLHHPSRPLTLAARCFVEMLERRLLDVCTAWERIYCWK